MKILYILFSSTLTLFIGIYIGKINLKNSYDKDTRKVIIKEIDDIIELAHARFNSETNQEPNVISYFDYKLRSLVDNTTLIPVIGHRAFDGEYMDRIGELFELTSQEFREVSPIDRPNLLEKINKTGIGLKKIVNTRYRKYYII